MVDEPHTQEEVEREILSVLEDGRVRTTGEITKQVKLRLPLTPEDKQRAAKRPNESKIDQIIANALQEKRTLCKSGLIQRVARGEFKITESGQSRMKERTARLERLRAKLDKLDKGAQ